MKGFTAAALAGAALFLTAKADVDPIVIKVRPTAPTSLETTMAIY